MFSRKVLGLTTFAFAIAALAAPSTAHASKARAEALTAGAHYGVDRVNVQHFPTALYRNQNMVFGELGLWSDGTTSDFDTPFAPLQLEDSDRSLGLYLGNLWEGRAGVFGFELNENGNPLSPTMGSEFVGRSNNESIALFWAQQFNSLTLGLEFNRMYSKEEDKTTGNEFSNAPYNFIGPVAPGMGNVDSWQDFAEAAFAFGLSPWNSTGFGAGVAFESQSSSGNTRLLEFSAEARKYTTKQEDITNQLTLENDNSISFGLNGRAMLDANQSLTWVPYVGFSMTDLGLQFNDVVTPANNSTFKNEMTNFEGGIAGNWSLRQNDLLVAGLAYRSSKIEWEGGGDTLTVTYSQPLYLFAGFEGNAFRWLTLRFGASKPVIANLKVEDPVGATDYGPTTERNISDSPFAFNLGAGFHMGNFTLDAVMNQDYTFSGGPLAAAGDNATIYPFSRLSLTYRY